MISNPRELHTALEFGVSIYLAAHRLETCRFFVYADFFCVGVYVDDTRGKTFLKLFYEIRRYGFCWVEDDCGEKTIGCGGCEGTISGVERLKWVIT